MNQSNKQSSNTKVFFEQAYGKKLTDEEVSKYKNRLVKFFSFLVEIDQKNKRKQKKL